VNLAGFFKRFFWIAILLVPILPIWYLADLPDTRILRTVNPKTSAIRTLREEQIRTKGEEPHSSMQWRDLSQISPYLLHAVVLSEDDTFFQHHGFDFEQLKRAAQTNWERKRFAFGASTITQQLARTLYLSANKNLFRKAKEALITLRLEKTLSKNRILELYMNVAEWGPQVYGAEAASQYFFNKSALELTPDEAISLAVILPSPRRWNPLSEKKFISGRRAALYDRMVMAHYIIPLVSSEPVVSPSLDNAQPPISEEERALEIPPEDESDRND
jgi:monofunctional biosynthetic peptidoglycan transglycosylase